MRMVFLTVRHRSGFGFVVSGQFRVILVLTYFMADQMCITWTFPLGI
jgi:hypothetical protein